MDAFLTTNGGSIRLICLAVYRKAMASEFIQKVAETFATRILLIVLGLIPSMIIARILGPEGLGFYAVATAIGAIGVQVGNLGLHASNTYYVARDRKLFPILVSNALFVSFVFGGLGAVLAWVIFSLWLDLALIHGLLLIFSLLWIPFGLAYLLLQNLLIGIYEVQAYNKIELVMQILSMVLLGLVIAFGVVTVETVFIASLISLVFSLSLALWTLRPFLPRISLPSFALFRNNIGYGMKAYLSNLFAFLVLKADLLMVKYMLDAKQAGYYSIAVTMADMVFMLPGIIAAILFPKLSGMSNRQEKWEFAKKVTLGTGFVMGTLVILATLVASSAVRRLFGIAFMPAMPAFLWLTPGIFFLGIEIVEVQFLNSIGFPKIIVLIWGFSCLLNIALNMWSIPKYGVIGASMVSSFSYFVVFVLISTVIKRTKS